MYVLVKHFLYLLILCLQSIFCDSFVSMFRSSSVHHLEFCFKYFFISSYLFESCGVLFLPCSSPAVVFSFNLNLICCVWVSSAGWKGRLSSYILICSCVWLGPITFVKDFWSGTCACVLVGGAGSCLYKALLYSSVFWEYIGPGMALGSLSANGQGCVSLSLKVWWRNLAWISCWGSLSLECWDWGLWEGELSIKMCVYQFGSSLMVQSQAQVSHLEVQARPIMASEFIGHNSTENKTGH